MNTYLNYTQFLSHRSKLMPYTWTQSGTHVDIVIANMRFDAISQGRDKETGNEMFRLSVLFGQFANKQPMTKQQLIDWLMQNLFNCWFELNMLFDNAAVIQHFASTNNSNDAIRLTDNFSATDIRCDTGTLASASITDVQHSHNSTSQSSQSDIQQIKLCRAIQSTVCALFGIHAASLHSTTNRSSNVIWRCKHIMLLQLLDAGVTINTASKYCHMTASACYRWLKQISFMTAQDMWQSLNLTVSETTTLLNHMNATKMNRIVSNVQLKLDDNE